MNNELYNSSQLTMVRKTLSWFVICACIELAFICVSYVQYQKEAASRERANDTVNQMLEAVHLGALLQQIGAGNNVGAKQQLSQQFSDKILALDGLLAAEERFCQKSDKKHFCQLW